VVLWPNPLTTEGSFDSPTVVPHVPWLYARASTSDARKVPSPRPSPWIANDLGLFYFIFDQVEVQSIRCKGFFPSKPA
jgi:hypothetical protein